MAEYASMQPLLIAVTSSVAADHQADSAGDRVAAIGRRLTAELGLSSDGRGHVERILLDSFDWRLYRHGWMLEHERTLPDGASRLRLRPLDTSAAIVEADSESPPVRPEDVADTPLRQQLSDLVGPRAIVPIVAVSSRWTRFRYLDDEFKTVGRVNVSEATIAGGGPDLGLTVQVLPVRGYPAEFGRLAAAVGQAFGTAHAIEPLLQAALAVGRPPGQDPSAFDIELPADATAPAAIRMLLGRVLSVMSANEPGVRDHLDDEFLHDFRVAVRRGRAIVHLARGLLSEPERQWLEGELRWLGGITSPCRDLDVLLEDLEAEHPELSSREDDLVPLLHQLRRWRIEAREELDRALESERYAALLVGLGSTAAREGEGCGYGGAGQVEPALAGPVLADRLRKVHRTMCQRGRRATTEEDWHDLRKLGKRLRYQLEGFRSLAAEPAAEALDALRHLQTTLGEAQDRAAHAALLHAAGLELASVLGASTDQAMSTDVARALLATGGLVEWHRRRGQVALDAAAKVFGRFDSRASHRRFERLWYALEASANDPVPVPRSDP
jgi:CHAD domain-containing protein